MRTYGLLWANAKEDSEYEGLLLPLAARVVSFYSNTRVRKRSEKMWLTDSSQSSDMTAGETDQGCRKNAYIDNHIHCRHRMGHNLLLKDKSQQRLGS